jgi:hypothetical protein
MCGILNCATFADFSLKRHGLSHDLATGDHSHLRHHSPTYDPVRAAQKDPSQSALSACLGQA